MFMKPLPGAAALFGRWIDHGRRSREKRAMDALPDWLLRDIGLTREDLRQVLSAPESVR
jgi:uncharacterized protein YjiS (DUF1127 family)